VMAFLVSTFLEKNLFEIEARKRFSFIYFPTPLPLTAGLLVI
jgi:hypothetical protein